MSLRDKLRDLPTDSGVYIYMDGDGKVLYVGKAKNLRNRVRQYFHASVKTEKVMAMVANIADFYYIITKSEIDALALENNLIKKYKPKYNILLKDDKTYPYIRVHVSEKYPAFSVSRRQQLEERHGISRRSACSFCNVSGSPASVKGGAFTAKISCPRPRISIPSNPVSFAIV